MRAIFLDRDGVINTNRSSHVTCWEEFVFLPGALAALRWLHEAGFYIFVVTNQAIVSRGLAEDHTIEDIHSRMALRVALNGGHIHDIRYCPHDRNDACTCRKPKPGMIQDLAAQWQIDLRQSYMVGDAWTDIVAGQAAGCRTILVHTGRGAEQLALAEAQEHRPDHIAADITTAVMWIFQQEELPPPLTEDPLRHRQLVPTQWGAAIPATG